MEVLRHQNRILKQLEKVNGFYIVFCGFLDGLVWEAISSELRAAGVWAPKRKTKSADSQSADSQSADNQSADSQSADPV